MEDENSREGNEKKVTDLDLAMPESRSLLPENHNELFGVSTNAFVMTKEDIEKETVLGSKFDEEIKQGRSLFKN